MNEDQRALDEFGGMARLFPLPNLVLFPQVVQPLHVFEPRYREMMSDALADNRLIALALLQPGWEEEYDARPALFPVACLGRIIRDQQLPDGRYNLLLRGVARVRLIEELTTPKLYRSARVELLPETGLPSVEASMELRRELASLVVPRFAANGPAQKQLTELFAGELPLGPLTDVLSFVLPLPLECKQWLLEETNVSERATRLLSTLTPLDDRKFPPDFSDN